MATTNRAEIRSRIVDIIIQTMEDLREVVIAPQNIQQFVRDRCELQFDLGFDSLGQTELIHRLSEEFGVDLSVIDDEDPDMAHTHCFNNMDLTVGEIVKHIVGASAVATA